MIKIIELIPNEYDFELKLKSLVNDGEFIGMMENNIVVYKIIIKII